MTAESKPPANPPPPKSPPLPRRPPSQPPTPRQNPRPLPPSPSNSDDLMALAEIAGVAAFPSGGDRAGGPQTPGAVSESFPLPNTRLPLVFAEGRRRLVGAVLLQDPPDPPQPFPPNPFPRPGWSS